MCMFLYCLPIISVSQPSSHLLQIAANVAYHSISGSYGLQPAMGLGLSFFVSPFQNLNLGVSAQVARPTATYDIIAGTGEERLQMSLYQICSSVQVADVFSITLDVDARLGVLVLSTNPREISAGGLGSITIPAKTDHELAFSLGPTVSKALTSRLRVFLSPAVFYTAPLHLNAAGYLMEGGLSLGIL